MVFGNVILFPALFSSEFFPCPQNCSVLVLSFYFQGLIQEAGCLSLLVHILRNRGNSCSKVEWVCLGRLCVCVEVCVHVEISVVFHISLCLCDMCAHLDYVCWGRVCIYVFGICVGVGMCLCIWGTCVSGVCDSHGHACVFGVCVWQEGIGGFTAR